MQLSQLLCAVVACTDVVERPATLNRHTQHNRGHINQVKIMQEQQNPVKFKRYSVPDTYLESRGVLSINQQNMKKSSAHFVQKNRKAKGMHLLSKRYRDKLHPMQYRVAVYQATVRPVVFIDRRKKRKKWKRKKTLATEATLVGAEQKEREKIQKKDLRKTRGKFVNLTRYKANLGARKVASEIEKTQQMNINESQMENTIPNIDRMGLAAAHENIGHAGHKQENFARTPNYRKESSLKSQQILPPLQQTHKTTSVKSFATYQLNKRRGGPKQKQPRLNHLNKAKHLLVSQATKPEKKAKPVFEFETNISVSLDGTGYALTLLLISQIVIFGMVIFAGLFERDD